MLRAVSEDIQTSGSRAGKPATGAQRSGLDGFFRISERGSTVGRELRGGLVTFLTMA